MRNRLTAFLTPLAFALALGAAGNAAAHVPDKCRPLFAEAGKTVEATIRKGNEANEVAMNGLDRGRRVSAWDYSALADRLAQLLGWQGDAFKKLAAAIECVRGKQ